MWPEGKKGGAESPLERFVVGRRKRMEKGVRSAQRWRGAILILLVPSLLHETESRHLID